MGRLPVDGHGFHILHPVGPGATTARATRCRRGWRGLPRDCAALVPHHAGSHHPAVPGWLHAGVDRLLARRHAHPDHLLEGAGTEATGENVACLLFYGTQWPKDEISKHWPGYLISAPPVYTGCVDGPADGRGLPIARAGPGVRVHSVRAARARRHVRLHGRTHLRSADSSPLRVLAAAPRSARVPRVAGSSLAARARIDAAHRTEDGRKRDMTAVRRARPLAGNDDCRSIGIKCRRPTDRALNAFLRPREAM